MFVVNTYAVLRRVSSKQAAVRVCPLTSPLAEAALGLRTKDMSAYLLTSSHGKTQFAFGIFEFAAEDTWLAHDTTPFARLLAVLWKHGTPLLICDPSPKPASQHPTKNPWCSGEPSRRCKTLCRESAALEWVEWHKPGKPESHAAGRPSIFLLHASPNSESTPVESTVIEASSW